ncbi:TonB-dependent receptor plug domain-containing protein [Erythrobacter sp. Dej080120_24]|uniref:TonB-dependent receptor plug domain-containing protein n=1 Tax=Erythrobacter sp. Dej080120_24 TaxID=3024837 RepID=UPI0030C665B1
MVARHSPTLMKQAILLCGTATLCAAFAPAQARAEMVMVASSAVDSAAEDETGQASTQANTRRTFVPEDFARFAPRSALDMARQIPGFSIREGEGDRGLGQADTNVLINGRRISGKSNGPVAALQRIPTNEVVRLELVDGASLDIGGLTGQVLNVVTASAGGISGQFRYSPQIRSRGTPARLYEGSVAFAGGGQKDEWTLALQNDSNRRGDDGPERVFDSAGNLIDLREEIRNSDFDVFGLSGSYTRIANNENVLNITGQIGGVIRRDTEISERSGPISPVDRTRSLRSTEDEFNVELGVDYQFAVLGGRLKLIAFHRYEDSPTTSVQITEFADGSPADGTRFVRDADEGETIGRAEFTFGALGGDLVYAIEGARNYLDISSALEALDTQGAFQPVGLAGASARVEEDRVDTGLTYSRGVAQGLQLQVSLGGEYSRISQSGPFGQTRTFYRPKGFVALDWKASSDLSIAGRVERRVGQLNFFDFIASVDLDQDRTDVTNANLVPPQSWVLEVEANIGLGALGSLALRPFYEDISDIVDQIPIAGGGQAPGNLPSAKSYGVEGDLTLLSEPLGWRGTRADLGFRYAGSSVRDPLIGNKRELGGFRTASINADLRHDFRGTSWAVGGSANWSDNAPNVRLDEIALDRESFAFVSAFVENKDIAGLTVRASVNNLVNRKNRFDRTVFADRAAGIVDFVEDRDRTFGMIFTLAIEGSF